MHNQHVTTGIVLKRVDYGEADRIVTLLTPHDGKLSLIAKGVRRVKSKLAGGIELFSVTEITYIKGRGDIGTLVSARLRTHYQHIVEDIDRTMLGYELIKQLNKATEDEPEPEYFTLLEQAFIALNDSGIDLELVRMWFSAQLLRLGGHTPNLQSEAGGTKLNAGNTYEFNFEDSVFMARPDAPYTATHIKFLRLVFSAITPTALSKINGNEDLVDQTKQLISLLQQQRRS